MHSSFIGIGLLKVIFQLSDFYFLWNSRSFHGQKVDFFLLFRSKSNLSFFYGDHMLSFLFYFNRNSAL